MPTSPMTVVNEQLRRALLRHDGAGRSDGELLGHLIDHRDEAALAALVQRHGPMVIGIRYAVAQEDSGKMPRRTDGPVI